MSTSTSTRRSVAVEAITSGDISSEAVMAAAQAVGADLTSAGISDVRAITASEPVPMPTLTAYLASSPLAERPAITAGLAEHLATVAPTAIGLLVSVTGAATEAAASRGRRASTRATGPTPEQVTAQVAQSLAALDVARVALLAQVPEGADVDAAQAQVGELFTSVNVSYDEDGSVTISGSDETAETIARMAMRAARGVRITRGRGAPGGTRTRHDSAARLAALHSGNVRKLAHGKSGATATVVVAGDGHAIRYDGTDYDSPSAAAKAAGAGTVNGWTWWRVAGGSHDGGTAAAVADELMGGSSN